MTEETIRNRLKTRILDCCPDVELAPQIVKDVYESAAEFFGEGMVDLQKTTIKESWEHALQPSRYVDLIEALNIAPDEAPSVNDRSADWTFVLQNKSRLTTVEDLITTEGILKTDLPLYTILVHFHDITVSNERDESVKIEDIYAAVPVTPLGFCVDYMLWLRTTVSKSHWISNYRHSHLRPGRGNNWLRPCLGSGPIRMTMETLRADCDLNFWSLFWLELNKCIRVESLQGGPYIYLNNISIDRQISAVYKDFDPFNFGSFNHRYPQLLDELALRMLHTDKLQYSFVRGAVHIANSYTDFTVLASNCLLDYFKTITEDMANSIADRLTRHGQLIYAQIRTSGEIVSYGSLEHFYEVTESGSELSSSDAGFMFKDKPVPFIIVDDSPEEELVFFDLLGPAFTTCLFNKLTTIANYVYARKQSNPKVRTNKK